MQAHRARAWLASLLAILASVFMIKVAERTPVLLLPAALPVLAAVLLHRPRLQAQLVARAALWAAMILHMLLGHVEAHVNARPNASIAVAVAGALALLVAGRVSPGAEPGAFQPAAYRKTLTLSLVLALADTFTLWMWTAFALLGGAPTLDMLGFLACAIVTLVGAIGLYRLRMWALALNVLANVGIALLFGARIIDVQELRLVFIASALAQLLVALPVLAGVILHRPLELPGWLQRGSRVLLPAALIAVIALALQPLFGRSVLVELAIWLLY
ncbi:MAG TPA: hypothetical protein VK932_26510 [Kofleriaceae bacterium]|nr:hypothetical protein [Kofleriaceae bacterium]